MDEQVLNLLRKYLNDQCSIEELEQVRSILHSDGYEEEWAAVLQEDAERNINENVSGVFDEIRTDKLLERIVASAGIGRSKIYKSFFKTPFFAAAASILILVTAGLAFYLLSVVSTTGNNLNVITMAGEQTEVLLPDGTRIWLKDQSTLSYPDEFDGDTRTVKLEGGAFFDVASNPSLPFLVQTDELIIRVLGTSFDVSAYKNDRDVSVSVASGRVSVTGPPADVSSGETSLNSNDKPVNALAPGDRLTYDRLTLKYYQQTMALDDIRNLNGGRLIFQNQTLGDIARALERRYNIQFRFEEELARDQRLTFKPNSSDLDEVLQVLSLVSGLEYEMSDSEVYMSGK